MQYVMGIDPSINYTGYSILTYDGKLKDYGLVKTWKGSAKPSDSDRLKKLFLNIRSIWNDWTPDCVCIEDYQWRHTDLRGRNKDHLKKLIWAIGVCIVAIPEGCDVELVKPQQWKGTKNKQRTIIECRAMFGLTKDLNNNASDAIMIANHYVTQNFTQRKLPI